MDNRPRLLARNGQKMLFSALPDLMPMFPSLLHDIFESPTLKFYAGAGLFVSQSKRVTKTQVGNSSENFKVRQSKREKKRESKRQRAQCESKK